MHKTVVRTRNLSQATRHSPPGGVDCWARDYTQAIYVVAGMYDPLRSTEYCVPALLISHVNHVLGKHQTSLLLQEEAIQ